MPTTIVNPDWIKQDIDHPGIEVYSKKHKKIPKAQAPGDFILKTKLSRDDKEITFVNKIPVRNEFFDVDGAKICVSVRVEVDLKVEIKDFWYEIAERNRFLV